MSKESTLVLLGILLILVPFVGLPSTVRTVFTILFAAGVVLISVSLKARMRTEKNRELTKEAEVPTHE